MVRSDHTIRDDIRNPDANADIHQFCDQLRHDAAEIKARKAANKSDDIDALAMAVAKLTERSEREKSQRRKQQRVEESNAPKKCTFCGKQGHSVEHYWSKDPSKKKGKSGEGGYPLCTLHGGRRC